MAWKLYEGDVREKLAEIPEQSVQTCITSPPYWGLRDYGQEGQLGLEPTPELYVQNMVAVFRGVWRVLRDDGTVWLNLGDSYNGSGGVGGDYNKGGIKEGQPRYPGRKISELKPKDLVGIPWMVAFALRADGWTLRSDIIWNKTNPMPESVTDRPTKSHEYIFLLTKSAKYFYDCDAIREPLAPSTLNDIRIGCKTGRPNKKAHELVKNGTHGAGGIGDPSKTRAELHNPAGRNKRTVWTVATQPYKEAHFAVFPEKLIEPCILAGTSPQACEVCGSPWERVVEREERMTRPNLTSKFDPAKMKPNQRRLLQRPESIHHTTGWQPTCTCDNEGKGRSVVLDPFAGSGTTLYVAEQHGRDSIGIELSEEYCKLIRKRMDNMQQSIFSLGVRG